MLNDTIIAIAKHMKIDFEESRQISHALSKGQRREEIVIKRYLEKYLPLKYGISSGIVIDSCGGQSKQQDIIIYDRLNTMRLFGERRDDDNQVFIPIENVFAVIEVKSNLTNEEIDDVIEKFESVNVLIQETVPINPVISISSNYPAPAGFCFAYTAKGQIDARAKRLKEKRLERNYKKHLSGIMILDQGVIQYSENTNVRSINVHPTAPNVSESLHMGVVEGENLLHFTMMLNQALNSIVLEQPNLIKYLENATENRLEKSICVPFDLMTDDMRIIEQGKAIPIKQLASLSISLGKLEDQKFSTAELLIDNRKATKYVWACYLGLEALQVSQNTIDKSCVPTYAFEFGYALLNQIIRPHFEKLQDGEYILTEDELLPLRKMLLLINLRNTLNVAGITDEEKLPLATMIKLLENENNNSTIYSFFIQAIKEKFEKLLVEKV